MIRQLLLVAVVPASLVVAALANADDSDRRKNLEVEATLKSVHEVPTLATNGRGTFEATIDPKEQSIRYRLRYSHLDGGAVQQAHIHLGQRHTTGSVVIFLCTNLGNAPAPACPNSGTVSGVISPAEVLGGATDQGLPAGAFDEVVRLLRSGNMYVNVHTETWPAGEIRGQVLDADSRH